MTEYLYDIGVKDVFMLSGTGSIHLDDAFAHQKGMNYTCARHEAAAVMMAMASAKLTGEIGVVIATTGPGGTNAVNNVSIVSCGDNEYELSFFFNDPRFDLFPLLRILLI